jgi:hypothetical protein
MQVCSPLFGVLYVCPYFTDWFVAAKDYLGISLVIVDNMYFVLPFPIFLFCPLVHLIFW